MIQKADVNGGTYVSVRLALMHTALVISGISGEAQMPRPNRLQVTPLHAQANWSQTKAQLAALGSQLWARRRSRLGPRVYCVCGNRMLACNNIQWRGHLSKHVYEELARRGSSSSLSRKTAFGYQVSCQGCGFNLPIGLNLLPRAT